jgi:hypothetical protein
MGLAQFSSLLIDCPTPFRVRVSQYNLVPELGSFFPLFPSWPPAVSRRRPPLGDRAPPSSPLPPVPSPRPRPRPARPAPPLLVAGLPSPAESALPRAVRSYSWSTRPPRISRRATTPVPASARRSAYGGQVHRVGQGE